ncbi:MAG: cytochrome c3 family protein [Vicinamibacterales bacterium]
MRSLHWLFSTAPRTSVARLFARVAMMALVGLVPIAAANAQTSRCADCHFANPGTAPAGHLSEWDHSEHGRRNVGCESCHGGNATTFESALAHQGILNSRNPASPVHRWNLPATCGKCHTGPFVAFQKSRHYALLRGGDRNVPTCASCHGEMGGAVLSAKGLEGECASCHGAGKVAPRSDYPPQGRMMVEGIHDARALLKSANAFIKQVKDKNRRAALEAAAQQADVPLIEATNAGHMFVYDQLQERLATARERIGKLWEALANPEVK